MTSNSLRTPPVARLRQLLSNRLWPRAVLLRRILAGTLFLLAVVLALLPSRAGAAGPSRPVLTATHALSPGVPLRPRDLQVRRLPSTAVPDTALRAPRQATGKLLTGPVGPGEQLTGTRVPESNRTRDGRTIVPVRLTDRALAGLLHPGTLVDVIASDSTAAPDSAPETQPESARGARTLATGARVVTVPKSRDDSNAREGRLVLLALPTESAHRVAASSLHEEVTVTMR